MFNFELYKEGLRKTKTLGILFIVGMLLGGIAQPLIEISNHINSVRLGWTHRDSLILVFGVRASLIMILAPFAGAPIITLSIFSFLNRRSDSDFYHAIPHKRETLFGSFIAAVLTWVIGGMWASSIISVIIYAVSSYAYIQLGSIILAVIGMSVASLLVIAATSLAMTITGNGLSNIVTTGLILFLPRGLTTMFVGMIIEMTRVVSSANFGLLGNNHYNILFGFFGEWRRDHNDVFTIGTVYTLVLGIIYLIVAGILFKKRHSELASNPGSKLIQHIIRVMVAFVITLPAILIIVNNNPYNDRLPQIQLAIVVYIIAAFSYFAYEFFTMKKIPKLIKMIPGLLVIAVLNVIFIIGTSISRDVILQEVDVANIHSIEIIDLNNDMFWLPSYAQLNLRGFTTTDNDITDFFGESLNNNIERFSRREGQGRHDFQFWDHNEVRVRLNIDGGRNITRSIWVRSFGLNRVLIEYEPYRELFMRMPENPSQISFWGIEPRESLTQEQLHHIYDVLREEVAAVDFEDWHEAATHSRLGMRASIFYDLEVTDHHRYRSLFPITGELTPRTLELLESYLGIHD